MRLKSCVKSCVVKSPANGRFLGRPPAVIPAILILAFTGSQTTLLKGYYGDLNCDRVIDARDMRVMVELMTPGCFVTEPIPPDCDILRWSYLGKPNPARVLPPWQFTISQYRELQLQASIIRKNFYRHHLVAAFDFITP